MQKIKTLLMSFAATIALSLSFVTVPATVVAAAGLMFTDTSDAAECTLYETIHPNFPLTGAHMSTGKCSTCASCHAGGVYLGTPKVCATCHNGNPSGQISASTIGKSAAHPPIGSTACDACHNTGSFTATWSMNHASVGSQTCTSCHNGNFNNYGAMPKDGSHIPTTADCGTCHVTIDNPTHTNADWHITMDAIHAGITTNCVSCHDGAHHPAMGKSDYAPGHPTTSDACETCHSITNSFKCASLFDDKLFKKMVQVKFVWKNFKPLPNKV